jgi:RNA polymerase sigma-70 factor (ECF subfamily)
MSGRAMKEEEDGEGDMHLAQHASIDPEARDRLVRRLRPRVQRLAASFLRDAADAEDAAQAAMLEILRATSSFRGESKLETWADRIAVRAAIRLARVRRLAAVRTRGTLDPDELPGAQLEPANESLPHALQTYLDALPEARRTVLVLRHALGYSVQEIADLTGVSANTVKDRLLSAREQVRKMVRRETVGCDAERRERS